MVALISEWEQFGEQSDATIRACRYMNVLHSVQDASIVPDEQHERTRLYSRSRDAMKARGRIESET
jgi:hypothetical protein